MAGNGRWGRYPARRKDVAPEVVTMVHVEPEVVLEPDPEPVVESIESQPEVEVEAVAVVEVEPEVLAEPQAEVETSVGQSESAPEPTKPTAKPKPTKKAGGSRKR